MAAVKQPENFFQSFLEDIKPSIEAFSPYPSPSWWVPYGHLLGMKQGTLIKWKGWRKLPLDAYQNASNILALQTIALLDTPDATLDDAKAIARDRLTDALADMPPPVPVKPRRERVRSQSKKFRRIVEDDAWHAAGLLAKGYRPPEIADEMGCSLRTVQRLLSRVLGDRSGQRQRRGVRVVA